MDMEPEELVAFAKRVKQERALYKTRTAFCQAVGITRTTLRALESGTQQPTQETIEKLAKVIGTTPTELVGRKGIALDHPLLKDLTEEDLRIAQMFHHAGLEVKQRTLGVMQARQPRHGTPEAAPDVISWAKRLLALKANQRYVVSALIAELEGLQSSEASDARVTVLAQRMLRLSDQTVTQLDALVSGFEANAASSTSTGQHETKPPTRKAR